MRFRRGRRGFRRGFGRRRFRVVSRRGRAGRGSSRMRIGWRM